ncbi:hypothetical protein B0H14DRAFT_2605835 [Mycena olivaceomarginata]|nr:hypothetical protein B0H14DRAFT_2605835 [Mycena olivaceomarginata]
MPARNGGVPGRRSAAVAVGNHQPPVLPKGPTSTAAQFHRLPLAFIGPQPSYGANRRQQILLRWQSWGLSTLGPRTSNGPHCKFDGRTRSDNLKHTRKHQNPPDFAGESKTIKYHPPLLEKPHRKTPEATGPCWFSKNPSKTAGFSRRLAVIAEPHRQFLVTGAHQQPSKVAGVRL